MSENIFKLNNGSVCLSISAPGGVFNADQLTKIASICNEKVELGKASSDESFVIYVAEELIDEISHELRDYGLVVGGYQIGLQKPISCLGAICPESMQDALQTALEIDKLCSQLQLTSTLKIGINGCARSCVANHTMDLALVGDMNGYRLSIGGKTSLIPEFATFVAEGIPAAEVSEHVHAILTYFCANAEIGENLYEFMDRVGTGEFVKILSPYSQDAAAAGDPFESTVESEVAVAKETSTEADLDWEESSVDHIGHGKKDEVLEDEIVLHDDFEESDSLEMIAVDNPGIQALDHLDQEVLIDEQDEHLGILKETDLEAVDREEEVGLESDDVAEQAFEEQLEEDLEVAEKINSDIDENEGDRQATLERIQDESAFVEEAVAVEEEDILLVDDVVDEELEVDSFADDIEETKEQPVQRSVKRSVSTGDWQLNNVKMLEDGVIMLQFNSGAEVRIDCERLQHGETRSLNFGGQELFLSKKDDGVEVIADGIAFFLPIQVLNYRNAG